MTKELNPEEVKRFICEIYREALIKKGYNWDNIPDQLDLLTDGIIDSLGILELISNLEERFQISIDLEYLPAEQLTILGPLSHHIAKHSIKCSSALQRTESASPSDP
jgi:acyl carrier protein